MKRFLRKALVWAAGVFATLVLLLVLFYAEEDWRGARDWAACQKELAAKGESLDLRVLAPPGKPEDDLSKVPIFAELDSDGRGWKIGPELDTANSVFKPKLASLAQGKPLDLASWQIYYRTTPDSKLPYQLTPPAQDVLTVLSRFDSKIAKIDTASSNPNAYWPINYERPFDTTLRDAIKMPELAKFLQLRAVAYLENHEADLAEKDYLLSFRLNQSLIKNCLMINYLLIDADRAIDDAILWEGLRRHAWSDVQLREMESTLASVDMLALAKKGFRTEQAEHLQTIKVFEGMDADIVGKAKTSEDSICSFIVETTDIRPRGWWDQDRCAYCRNIQKNINAIDESRGKLSSVAFPFHDMSDSWAWNQANDIGILETIYTPLAAEARGFDDNMGPKIAHTETTRRLARLACRLEEFRLAKGQYPEKLEELPDLPAHLNQEVLSEQPLRYQRKGDGYLLYSVGWNQKDEGGLYAADEKEGDWVWPGP